MKTALVKFLSIAAVLTFATSCSKDDKDEAPITNTTNTKGEPITITVAHGTPTKKIAYTDGGTEVTIKFEAQTDDNLEMTITDKDGTHTATLWLTDVVNDDNAIFNGNWGSNGAPTANTELSATIIYNSGSKINSSTGSITDLMKKCEHKYTGTFNLSSNNYVTLTDNRAYIEFTLADDQNMVYVNDVWYNVNQESHKAWVAVEGNTEVSLRLKPSSKTLDAGKIYTIECTKYVDMGQTVNGKKILWQTKDKGRDIMDDESHYYSNSYLSNELNPFRPSIDGTDDRLPTEEEFVSLQDFISFDNEHNAVCISNQYGTLWLTPNEYWQYEDNMYVLFHSEEETVSTKSTRLSKKKQVRFSSGNMATTAAGDEGSPSYRVRLVRGL